MTISTSRESDRFMLRLPDGMREQLKKLAADHGRSLNAEIVARLEESLAKETETVNLFGMLERGWEERKQLSDIINSQDRALQTVRRSHKDLVTIAKQLGETFLANATGQPAFLIALAQMLADFEIEEDSDPSEEIDPPIWDQYPPDPIFELQRQEALDEAVRDKYDDEPSPDLPTPKSRGSGGGSSVFDKATPGRFRQVKLHHRGK